MGITAKELANMLDLSEAAVSMALNGKSGVSTETKNKVLKLAKEYDYDFSRINHNKKKYGTIYFIMYRKYGAVVSNTEFFENLTKGLHDSCKELGYKFVIHQIMDGDDIQERLNSILKNDCIGIILLGTEMYKEDFFPFAYIGHPIVLLDSFFNSTKMDSVLMNNTDGAYQATRHLIQKRQTQPGYLHSSYKIHNFEERYNGFTKALRDSGLSPSKSIIHLLPPSLEGAYTEMLNIIERGDELADCYFADNDLIAAGAMKAFKRKGYKIPEDVGFVGFDNIALCTYLEPNLTSVNVPIRYMCRMAVKRLIEAIEDKRYSPIRIEVNTNLVRRQSV